MEVGLLICFWYGILHAFSPDHLCAIIDFSLGKSKKTCLLLTIAFALGHGLVLLIFAQLISLIFLSEQQIELFTYYADMITGFVLLSFGLYLLFMVLSDQIQLSKHVHNGQEHVHISFGKNHLHDNNLTKTAFSLGSLMGMGGVRSLLISLSLVSVQESYISLVVFFALGVMAVFICFGFILLYINQSLLNNNKNVQIAFGSAGLSSVLFSVNLLI